MINFPPSLSAGRQFAAITFSNVDQTTPFDPDAHVEGYAFTNPSIAITTTEPGEFVLYYLMHDISTLTFTPDDPQLWYVDNTPSNNTASRGAGRVQETAGTMSVGGAGNYGTHLNYEGPWDLIAIPIRPAN